MAAETAEALHGELLAFYIATPEMNMFQKSGHNALKEVATYASSLHAHLTVVNGSDPVYLVGEFCRNNNVTILVLNRPAFKGVHQFFPTFAQRVSAVLGETTLLTVPGPMTVHASAIQTEKPDIKTSLSNLLLVTVTLLLATLLCYGLDLVNVNRFIFPEVYTVAILLNAAMTGSFFWAALSAVTSALLYLSLFVQPGWDILFSSRSFWITLLCGIAVSMFGALIGVRMKSQVRQARRTSWNMEMLLDNIHKLQKVQHPSEIVSGIGRRIADISERDVVFYPYTDGLFLDPVFFDSDPDEPGDHDQALLERMIAREAMSRHTYTGSLSEYYPEAEYLYFPLETSTTCYGVMGIRYAQEAPDTSELMVLKGIVAESVRTLEALLQQNELEEAKRQQESTILRSNLLKAVGHDIRTPLTSIMGNIANYKMTHNTLSAQEKETMLTNIQQAALNLQHMIENMLTAARMDSSSASVKLQPDLLEDAMQCGLEYPQKTNLTHPITIDACDDVLLTNMDSSLITQVVSNLVANAIQHTPEGTPIKIRLFEENEMGVIEVIDEGQGIKDEEKERIFEMFYTADLPSFDSDHYLGLGLFLCKAIMSAHHGSIEVRDNPPHGSIFSLRIPLLAM
ncbi:DUF4118 domain-containing protein [Erysipelotrichaceae bacterium RD49]|nr:DUF4118 domain-containing protein [Erysipelotrichaceae bacterium RD49]